VDIKVTDNHGRICPLCDGRITFEIEGNAVFLGGYNSGRFDGNGKNDNVIHQKYVYAECGINRVFLKSTRQAGKVVLYASMEPGICSKVQWQSRACDLSVLSKSKLTAWYPQYQEIPPVPKTSFCAIAAADEQKYVAETEDFCKILVDGQEPDFRGVRAVNRKGSIWGNVICILDSLQRICGDKFSYQYQLHDKKLILESGGHMIVAEAGVTHLLIDGNENLIDGEPYITDEGIFVMEVNTFLSNIQEVSVQYDEKIHALRIKTK
jgi:beta-galactosidase